MLVAAEEELAVADSVVEAATDVLADEELKELSAAELDGVEGLLNDVERLLADTDAEELLAGGEEDTEDVELPLPLELEPDELVAACDLMAPT